MNNDQIVSFRTVHEVIIAYAYQEVAYLAQVERSVVMALRLFRLLIV